MIISYSFYNNNSRIEMSFIMIVHSMWRYQVSSILSNPITISNILSNLFVIFTCSLPIGYIVLVIQLLLIQESYMLLSVNILFINYHLDKLFKTPPIWDYYSKLDFFCTVKERGHDLSPIISWVKGRP